MSAANDDLTEPLSREAVFVRKFSQASTLSDELTTDRIFRIHSQTLYNKFNRQRMAIEKFPLLDRYFSYIVISWLLPALTLMCFPFVGLSVWSLQLGASLSVIGISVLMLRRQENWRDYWKYRTDSQWKFSDINQLSSEDRNLTGSLCAFPDQAEGMIEPTARNHVNPRSKPEKAPRAIYNFCPNGMFRLVYIEGGDFDAPIICQLRIFPLAQHKYTALPYVWGDMKAMESITLNGLPFKIGQNLAAALRHIRHPQYPLLLWIDAICINQADDKEKTVQVAAMSDIYQLAGRVVIFLGAGCDFSSFFNLCQKFHTHIHGEHDPDEYFEKLNTNSTVYEMWYLLSLPWWRRSWIVQEVAQARCPLYIMYGKWMVSSGAFYEVLEHFRERLQKKVILDASTLDLNGDDDSSDRPGMFQRWADLNDKRSILLWYRRSHAEISSVADLLYSTRKQQATDPRDKVFAFTSLMMEPMRTAFAPNYARSESSVFTRMAAYLLCIQRWGRIYHTFLLPTARPTGFPSWLPDFSTKQNDGLHELLWADAPAIRIGNLTATVKSGVLAIHGSICGRVEEVVNVEINSGGPSDDLPATMRSLLEEVWHIIFRSVPRRDETSYEEDLEKVYRAVADVVSDLLFTRKDLDTVLGRLSSGRSSRLADLNPHGERDINKTVAFGKAFLQELRHLRRRSVHTRILESQKRRAQLEDLLRPAQPFPGGLDEIARRLEKDLRKDCERDEQALAEGSRDQALLRNRCRNEAKKTLHQAISQGTLFTTDTGLTGFAPQGTRKNDHLFVFHGIECAFTGDPTDEKGTMALAGNVWLGTDSIVRIEKNVKDGVFKDEILYFR